MRILNTQIFDEVIIGTGLTWYTAPRFNGLMGEADGFAIQAVTTMVSGAPTLTVQGQHSGDDLSWVPTPTAEISTSIVNEGAYVGGQTIGTVFLLPKLRFMITLAGTTPQCRLKLYFTGRVFGGRTGTPAERAPVRPMGGGAASAQRKSSGYETSGRGATFR